MYIHYTDAYIWTVGSTGDQEYFDLIPFCIKRNTPTWASVLPLSVGCTDAQASVKPVLLFFLFCSWIDLDLISSLIVSSSKCCIDFFGLFWAVFERVCKICKANSILVKLLTQEPLLIVRSRTKNYETLTKSSDTRIREDTRLLIPKRNSSSTKQQLVNYHSTRSMKRQDLYSPSRSYHSRRQKLIDYYSNKFFIS